MLRTCLHEPSWQCALGIDGGPPMVPTNAGLATGDSRHEFITSDHILLGQPTTCMFGRVFANIAPTIELHRDAIVGAPATGRSIQNEAVILSDAL